MISISVKPNEHVKEEDKKEVLMRDINKAQLELLRLYEQLLNPSEELNNNHVLKEGYFWTTDEWDD